MTNWIMENLLLTAGGAGAIIFIVARLVPNEKLHKWGVMTGIAVTVGGRRIFGQAFWERFEREAINWGGIFFAGFLDGLTSDNGNNK